MKKTKSQPQTPPRPLAEDALAHVTGGEGVVSPRDPASGMPTGKRQH